MTWQDELQKLDNELASGRISADDYRRRRDEVLSGSAGAGPAQNPQQQGPFAPPFKWEAQPPSMPTSDRTQVVNVQGPGPQQAPNPDATQVVSGGQRPADADRTQFVAPVSPPQGGWGPGPQQQQQAAAPPPWVGGDFDQINQPSPSWSHGPEVFDESGGGGKGKIFAIIGVVLVLVLIGGGIWWFTAGSKTETQTTASSTPPPTTSSSAGPKLPLNGLQGKVDPANTGPITVEKASKEQSHFSPDEAALMTTCGGETGLSQVLFSDEWFTQVHVFTCSDETAVKVAVEALTELQKTYGFAAGTGPKQLPAMMLEKATDVPDAPFDQRLFYASKNTIVRIEVRGKSKAAMDSGMEKVFAAVDKNYPAK